METTTGPKATLHKCKLCGQRFTVRGSIKEAREIHEARYCPEYWEQGGSDSLLDLEP